MEGSFGRSDGNIVGKHELFVDGVTVVNSFVGEEVGKNESDFVEEGVGIMVLGLVEGEGVNGG